MHRALKRPYNEEEAQTEDEGATVKPPTRDHRVRSG